MNGSGKSTLYQINDSFKNMPRINVDEIVKEYGDWRNFSDVLRAGKIVIERISQYMNKGITLCKC